MLMKVAVECAIVVQQVQSFAKKNGAPVTMVKDEGDVIENEFLSSLVEYDATEDQVLEDQVVEADEPVVLTDLERLVDEDELEDASIKCMAGKEESKEPKIELLALQEVDSLLVDPGSGKSMLMAAYVDDWLDAQVWQYGKVLQVDGSDQNRMFDLGELQSQFLKRFREVIRLEEAGAKLKAVRKDVSKDFFIFNEQFESCWKQLEVATWIRSSNYLKLSKLLECLHPRIREKVEDGADTYEDIVYLAKVKNRKVKLKMELGVVNPLEYVPVAAVAECYLVQPKVDTIVQNVELVKVRPMVELVKEEELHIEVNQEAKKVADVGIPMQPKEMKPILVESLHEKVAECSQVADTKDLEVGEGSEQNLEEDQAFGERQANGDANGELVYGADDDGDTSSNCLETSEEDRAHESTSYGKESEPNEPKLVLVKLRDYVFDDMIVPNVQEEQRIEQVDVHDEDQVERSRPTGDDKQVKLVCGAMLVAMLMKVAVERAIVVQQVQSFAKKNEAAVPMEKDKGDAIENEFLSSLVEYDAAEDQVLEDQVVEADEPVVLTDLEGPIDEDELEDASIKCMAGKEESKEPKIELSALQVCSMTGGEDSQVFLEENLTLHGLEGGSDVFNVNDDLLGDAFDGVLWEADSLPMDPGSGESMLMAAYVDDWLDAQRLLLGRSSQCLKLSKLLECLYPRIREKVEDGADTYEDMVYLAKNVIFGPTKGGSNFQNVEPVKVRPMVDYVPWRNPICDVHVPTVDELINEEELHIEVNEEANKVADVGVPMQPKEMNHFLVESLHEKVAECSQLADTKDLEVGEGSEQNLEDDQAFGEQQANEDADGELVYGADYDGDTSSSCWETSGEDRADESTSYGEETEPNEPKLDLDMAKGSVSKEELAKMDDKITATIKENKKMADPAINTIISRLSKLEKEVEALNKEREEWDKEREFMKAAQDGWKKEKE
ncbi:hypothetical protein L7F22_002137 [Adiantum nelumboides]|nr:hypothetical protein [Adiantum nelumboides]